MTVGNHSDSIRSALTILVVLILGGCSNNTVQIIYDTSAVASQPAVVANSIRILSESMIER